MNYRLRVLKAWGPAVLSALLLVFSLFLLWAVTDFPLPREATLRRLENQALLPHGTTLASGTVELEPFAEKTPRFTWTLRGDGEQTWVLLTEAFGPLSRSHPSYGYRSVQAKPTPFWGELLELQSFSVFSSISDGSPETDWATQFCFQAYADDPSVARVEALAGWQEEPGKLDGLAAGTLTPAEDGAGVWIGILTQDPSPSGSLVWRVRAYDTAGNLLYEDCSNPERFVSLP